jgi:hypothetical protein
MRFFFMGPRILGIRPGISFSVSELLRLATKPKQNKAAEPMTGGFVWTLTLMCITVITRIAPAATFSQVKTIAVAPPRLRWRTGYQRLRSRGRNSPFLGFNKTA